MKDNSIQFKRQRELGEIITDTFKFFRENYKALFKALIKNVGPFFLILVAATIYYNYSTLGSLASGELFKTFDTGMGLGNLFASMAFLIVSILIYYALLYGTILNFIKDYIQNDGTISQSNITHQVKYTFWELIGLGVVSSIILFLGLALCVIPGIYVMVPLTLVFAILIFEKKDILGSISHSFQLIKNNWWMSFITIFIFAILLYIIGLVVQIPMFLYTFVKAFTISSEISQGDPSSMFDWVYVTLSVISNVFQYLLYIFYAIMTAFLYFNLNERKNYTGTIETIDNLGNRSNSEL